MYQLPIQYIFIKEKAILCKCSLSLKGISYWGMAFLFYRKHFQICFTRYVTFVQIKFLINCGTYFAGNIFFIYVDMELLLLIICKIYKNPHFSLASNIK